MGDALMVLFDLADDGGVATLAIARVSDDQKTDVVNMFTGRDAVSIYRLLTEPIAPNRGTS